MHPLTPFSEAYEHMTLKEPASRQRSNCVTIHASVPSDAPRLGQTLTGSVEERKCEATRVKEV